MPRRLALTPRLLPALMAALIGWSWPAPAHATLAPGIQGFQLSGTVDRFPCLGGPCGGSLSGVGTATVAGQTISGGAFTAVWPDPTQPVPSSNTTGALSSVMDSCAAGGPVPSDNGGGSGSFTLSGGLLNLAGQGLSGNATLSGNFGFIREAGDGLVITVSAATITSGTGVVVAYQADLVVGVGAGAFAVINGIATCGAPLTPAQVVIMAVYLAPE